MIVNVLFLFILVNTISCGLADNSYALKYNGEKFPVRYLVPEDSIPSVTELNGYIKTLRRIIYYFNKSPNGTDSNVAVGTFYTKAILKRALRDYSMKLTKVQHKVISDIINKCENIISHYIYTMYSYGWEDIEFRVSRLLKDDMAVIHSIGEFTKGRLNKWLFIDPGINDFAEHFDDISLSRHEYVVLSVSMNDYSINIRDSDMCLSHIVYNPEPIDMSRLQLCRFDRYCAKALHTSPSVAYALSHRLLNVIMRYQIRRCYINGEIEDKTHMEQLCASMYRETVYLARRGFFARDLFLEHVGLCGLMGFEELHRRRWFNKALSWVDEQGCIQENRNYDLNMTTVMIKRMAYDDKRARKLRIKLYNNIYNECHTHPMTLLTTVLAHGIRYALHYLPAH